MNVYLNLPRRDATQKIFPVARQGISQCFSPKIPKATEWIFTHSPGMN